MNQRPLLNKKIVVKDFTAFYWLKTELVSFCKTEGLSTSGGKIDIAKRIERYLTTGERPPAKSNSKQKPNSTFNWKTEKLSVATKITDSYKNTENVRLFFEQQIGSPFKFNVKFMNWMKANNEKTLQDAITAWKSIKTDNKKRTAPKDIAPQFEYNRYLRDFMADHPNSTRAIGIQLWKIKKATRGDNVYQKADFNLLE